MKQKTPILESKFQKSTNPNRRETAFLQAEYEISITLQGGFKMSENLNPAVFQ